MITDHQILNNSSLLYLHSFFSGVWTTLDPQGLIKGSPQISINFHNSGAIACRAYKFGVYIQHTNK